jgi:hypothetical protein
MTMSKVSGFLRSGEPWQRLDGGDPGQRLVRAHPAGQRLVEPGLVLIQNS